MNLQEEEVLGKNCFEVLYQQNLPEACPCFHSLKEKKPFFQQMRLLKDKSEKEVYLKIWTHPVFDNKGEVEMVVEYAKFEETPRVVSDIDPGKEEVPREFFNNMNNIFAGILGK